jgi:Fic family protein
MRRAERTKRADGVDDNEFQSYDNDVTEAQVARSPAYADITLDGNRPRGELAEIILRRFVPFYCAPALIDDGETVSRMGPLLIADDRLSELARQVIKEAAEFAEEVPLGVGQPLADLVRAMNCYYSNRIEGHLTTPEDIERALEANYDSEPHKRHLQAEARAHIAVQEWIDEGNLVGRSAASSDALREIHDHFLSEIPEALWIEDPDSKRRVCVIPGHYRTEGAQVGRHVAPSPGSVSRFMGRFEEVFSRLKNPVDVVMAAAAAHHRLLWIHPFADGNGRVARLMSDAMLSDILHTHSIWSVSRGLAHAHDRYKALLADCDTARRNDLDGRGNLSEEGLVKFTHFFLRICLDQIGFMRERMRLEGLKPRLEEWVNDAKAFGLFHPSAMELLERALGVGALSRNEVHDLLSHHEKSDETLEYLIKEGVLAARGNGVAFSLPPKLAKRLFPGLFP